MRFLKKMILSCFSGPVWMMTSSVSVITKIFLGTEVKDKVCYRFSHQMYNWKLPHVNLAFNLWGISIWQNTNFTEAMDRTLWSTKPSRSAWLLRIYLCENKRKRTLVRTQSIFSNVFTWATRRSRTIEGSWHLHSFYPILAAGRHLPMS